VGGAAVSFQGLFPQLQQTRQVELTVPFVIVVLWPSADGQLGRFLHRWLNAHVRRYHRHYHSSGHLWQGRTKTFAIAQDEHLLTVLRYIEYNPVRAGLVERAEQWPWSSARWWRPREKPPLYLHTGPVDRGPHWLAFVNQPLTLSELAAVRTSVNRSRPYGPSPWVQETATQLGLEKSLRPPGRPTKTQQPSLFPLE
jgi:putative transposase